MSNAGPVRVLRVAPLAQETVFSLLGRIAGGYAIDAGELRSWWQWRNQAPRTPGAAGPRPDAEILLNQAGRRVLAELCRTSPQNLAKALPAWDRAPEMFGTDDGDPQPLGQWRTGSTVHAPVAYACRSCTARRTGQPATAMRYRHGWQRVCPRHQRWALDAGDSHGLQHLALRHCPDIISAQHQWAAVARRAQHGGVDPGAVFVLARAVVCQWWEQALEWPKERIWPARLHQLAGGDTGRQFWWWRAVAREAATFPELVTVAGALLDPAMRGLVWADSGGERIRPIPPDGSFCRELGDRLGRSWLGEEAAANSSPSLLAWMGAILREHRGVNASGWGRDPWRVRREDQPVSVAAQLRKLAERADGTISWRASVPPGERTWIQHKLRETTDLLASLDLHDTGHLAATTRHLLDTINQSVRGLDQALVAIAGAAHTGGVPLDHLSAWTHIPAQDLQHDIAEHRETLEGTGS
ncbi:MULTISPECIES: TniQ family protein [unclassified Streptomyces]|uniref:TniQ family protein n=1 Tax=unclassified Streptomyces TaxID=2593676 RepID=UPI001BEC3759|nr:MULTISPECIES: TniQ family protein [unclassified Streptomyces]MBT2407693.1 TniQ family protein [Streptomyces sp. ISL-21]MBT2608629.1 TniQ family protein [Streptomyces sp. ISL-87]